MRLIALITSTLLLFNCGGGSPDKQPAPSPASPSVAIVGLDIYLAGNGSKSCKWLDTYHDVDVLGMTLLWLPEGRSDSCLIKFLHDTRPTVIQLLIANGVCERKGNCTEAEQVALKERMITNTIEALEFINTHSRGPLTIEIIATLEDNLTYAEAKDVCRNIKAVAGTAEVWRNPVKAANHNFDDDCFDGVRLHNAEELPTNYRGKCAWSNDGLDINVQGGTVWALPNRISVSELLSRGARWRERGCDVYLWNADFSNCLSGDTAGASPTHRRDCSESDSDFYLMTNLLEESSNV